MNNKIFLVLVLMLPLINGFTQDFDSTNYLGIQLIGPLSDNNKVEDSTLINISQKLNQFNGIDTSYYIWEMDSCLMTEHYTNGEVFKIEWYYPNGDKRGERNYKNNKWDGIQLEWHSNGIKKEEKYYKNGKRSGLLKQWYETGELYLKVESKNNKELAITYFKGGQIESETEVNAQGAVGDENIWCQNGMLKMHLKNQQGKQPFVVYNCEGRMINEATMINIPLYWVGEFTVWYDNGQKKFIKYYKEGNTTAEANYRIGTWSYWNEAGHLIKQEIYEHNKLVDEKEFPPVDIKKEKL